MCLALSDKGEIGRGNSDSLFCLYLSSLGMIHIQVSCVWFQHECFKE